MGTSLYRLSFPAGFKLLVARLAERDFGPDSVVAGDESSILVRLADAFKDPGYFHGASLVIAEFPCISLEAAYRGLAASLREQSPGREVQRVFRDKAFMRAGRAERFIVRGFDRGVPTFPGDEPRRVLENAISASTGARPDSSRPDIELAVALRADGRAFLSAGIRTKEEPAPAAGALPRQTARLLCEMSRPNPEDVFLDPFMGSGSIPFERALMAPYKLIFAGDKDIDAVSTVKGRLKEKRFEKKRKTFFPKQLDARDLSRFDDGLFSCIATDPPWGNWERMGDEALIELYAAFFAEAKRKLRSDGRLVVLSGRNDLIERSNARIGSVWSVEENYDVLISGKKARAARLAPN